MLTAHRWCRYTLDYGTPLALSHRIRYFLNILYLGLLFMAEQCSISRVIILCFAVYITVVYLTIRCIDFTHQRTRTSHSYSDQLTQSTASAELLLRLFVSDILGDTWSDSSLTQAASLITEIGSKWMKYWCRAEWTSSDNLFFIVSEGYDSRLLSSIIIIDYYSL